MPGFDVLAKELNLFQNHFLEASAGTGKTFAIEHIVLRLLIEENGPTLDKILVVTFTKAATLELKRRIRKTLEKALENPLSYPFLIDVSENALFLIQKKLLRALSLFDEAKIMTIHSFCHHCLVLDNMDSIAAEVDESDIFRMIKDYLRTECAFWPPFRMDRILRSYQLDMDSLVKDLSKIALKRIPIECGKTFEELQNAFSLEMEKLQDYDSDKLLQDLIFHAMCFKGMSNKNRELKEDIYEELRHLSLKNSDLTCYKRILEMQDENLLKKKPEFTLHYPDFLKTLQRHILPLLEDFQDDLLLYAQLAEGVRKHLLKEKQALFHDDLLLQMAQKVQTRDFAQKIRAQFDAVLIDEFQDTDHLQWKIFSTLFGKSENDQKPLYLIGDPKQSIYRFRGADIYTYLDAKNTFHKNSQFTLNRNFRSNPDLVIALNHLFSARNPFLKLPKSGESLIYPMMESDPKNAICLANDGKGSIHIWDGIDEADFFPCIVDEIRHLSSQWNIALNQFAILVKDRHQADRFQKYARTRNLHTVSKRSRPLTSGKAYQALTELLEGISHIKQKGILEKILGGAIFSYSQEKMISDKENAFAHLCTLKETLYQKGILIFFHSLMEWLYEDIISREEGVSFYSDLLQLVEILAENVVEKEEYLSFLQNLQTLSDDAEMIQAYAVGLEEMVPILTIHGSKGLEFEVVFSLGTMLSSKSRRELIYDAEKGVYTLSKEAFLREEKEGEVEKIRLFYVAATRAKKRLYLPYLAKETSSPLSLFLEEAHLEHIDQITRSPCIRLEQPLQSKRNSTQSLKPPDITQLKFVPCTFTSFSRLSANSSSFHEKSGVLVNPSLPSLPLGKETGNLIHKIWEKLPLEKVFTLTQESQLSPFIRHFIEKWGYETHEHEICQLIFSTLQTYLPNIGRMCDLNPQKIVREIEFLYPSSEGYLKGFIDLLFEHEGKLYIIDWKTNCLENYQEESLKKAMQDNFYDMQESIYREAATRYGKQFNIPYGGTFFIFIRGMSEGKGVYVSKT